MQVVMMKECTFTGCCWSRAVVLACEMGMSARGKGVGVRGDDMTNRRQFSGEGGQSMVFTSTDSKLDSVMCECDVMVVIVIS